MAWISLIVAAAAPGICLLIYFYLKDKYKSEPLTLVLKVFLIGVLIVFPIMIIQRGLLLYFGDPIWFFSFVVSAGVEEFFKWLIIYYYVYAHVEFDEPYDGVVYAVSISLGFATMENVLFALSSATTLQALLIRAILPVSGHALFGVIMGYYFGKSKFLMKNKRKILLYALIAPIFLHGVYDFILLTFQSTWIYLMIPFMIFLWIRSLSAVEKLNKRSPYRSIRTRQDV